MIPASPPPEPRASEWRGILDADAHGERTRTAVEATVRAIADDLIRATVESPAALHGDLSLGRGAPGAALFLAYWGQYLADRAPRAADLACAASRPRRNCRRRRRGRSAATGGSSPTRPPSC